MENQLNEGKLLVNRVKLLMGYDMSKTLNENTQNILEQPDSRFDTQDTKDILRQGQKELDQQKAAQDAKERAKQYPNWCKYPDKAVAYPNNPDDAEGEDAILKDPITGIRFCYYPVPSSTKPGEIESLPIPEDSEIFWWDIPGISDWADQIIKKYPKLYNTKDDKEKLIQNLSKILPLGTVRQFKEGRLTYNNYITLNSGIKYWKFTYFRESQTKQPYPLPKWNDPRNDWQKFVDQHFMLLQLGTLAASIVGGFFSFGTTWGISTTLLIEIILELGVGSVVAWRDFEKGNNVAGASSILFAALPLLKTSRWFKGINPKAFEEVSEQLLKSGLNKTSTVEDYVKFYNGLSEEGKTLMSQMLKTDKYTQEVMWQGIKSEFEADFPKLFKKGLSKYLEKNPGVLKDLKFFEKLWVRELMVASDGIFGTMTIEALFGKYLNNPEKEALWKVSQYMPPTLQKEFVYNLLLHLDDAGNIVTNVEKTSKFKSDKNRIVNGFEKLMNTNIKNEFKNRGLTYVELPDDKTIGDDLSDLRLNSKNIDIYRKNGWKPIKELTDDDNFNELVLINGDYWAKTIKINNTEDSQIKTNDTIR